MGKSCSTSTFHIKKGNRNENHLLCGMEKMNINKLVAIIKARKLLLALIKTSARHDCTYLHLMAEAGTFSTFAGRRNPTLIFLVRYTLFGTMLQFLSAGAPHLNSLFSLHFFEGSSASTITAYRSLNFRHTIPLQCYAFLHHPISLPLATEASLLSRVCSRVVNARQF